ncbi:peptidase [Roseibium aquae]|uniref:Peptidase n=1 Tax=Roseibium aquae TaxID=1323746 RepID=A0A916TLZ2_9HYPH|nr:peptidase [Roseibium aquae]
MTRPPLTRSAIVAAARSWLGTPYVHQAARKHAGCDCLGLVRGVWREVMGCEPETPPPYTPDWAERSRTETLRDAAARHLIGIDPGDADAGDVLLFAFRDRLPAKHCALLTTAIDAPEPRILHAHEHLPVCEVPLIPAWRARIRFAFKFPGVVSAQSAPQARLRAAPDGAPPPEGSPQGGAPVRRN